MAQALAALAPCGVVVAVSDDFDAARRCLDRIARHTPPGHRVVLVDDASADARIAPLLQEFAACRAGTVVLEHARPLGFIGAVNRGLAGISGDVVVLRVEAEVTAGWLEGLARCRASSRAIGVACPLDDGSVEGVLPLFERLDWSIDVDAVADCVRRAARHEYPRLATVPGPCVLLSRELRERLGAFDDDLARRARDLGFEIACCDDVYVRGPGEGSAARGLGRVIETVAAEAERTTSPDRPRVLVVAGPPEGPAELEPELQALVEALKDDVSFTVALPTQGEAVAAERIAPHLRVTRILPGDFGSLLGGGFDVVQFQTRRGWGSSDLVHAARESGARIVLCARDDSWLEAPAAVAGAHVIACPTQLAAAAIGRSAGDAAAVRVIPPGVLEMPLVFPSERRPMLRVAWLGPFSAGAGAALLVEAARRLAGQRILFESWGAVEQALAAPAAATGILLRGPCAGDELPRALREIDLVVAASVEGGSDPRAVRDAQQLGIPVAAFASGAVGEYIEEGRTGFLVPPGNPEALAALLLRLRDDAKPLEAVAANLRANRQRSHAQWASEYLALYRERFAPREARAQDAARSARQPPAPPRAADAGTFATVEFPAGGDTRDEHEALRALNQALRREDAEWVVLRQAGDQLAEGAMETLAQACRERPRAALVYAGPAGSRRFSAELLRHSPYIAGLCAVRRRPLVESGGLRAPGWAGVVEYALRLSEAQDPLAVAGLDEALVSRQEANVRALESPEAASRLRELVALHLRRIGSRAHLAPATAGAAPMWTHREAAASRIPVLLRASSDPANAAACVEGLLRSSARVGTIFIDLPADRWGEIGARLRAHGHRDARPVPAGAAGLHAALLTARGEWLALVDGRCEALEAGWLERLEEGATGPYCGAIAPDLLARDGSRLRGWEPRGEDAHSPLRDLPREVAVLSGRLALMRRDLVVAIGAYMDLASAGAFAMQHLCLALRSAGYDCVARPFIAGRYDTMPHAAAGDAATAAQAAWMRERWGAQAALA